MPRNAAKRNHMRSHLAYLAARLMAETGSEDFAQAKLKAARQAGVPDTQSLPDNREIEAALRSYQALYQRDEQGAILQRLRRQAVDLMDELAGFNPYLVGSVLTGTAGRYSDINLHLFCDSSKDVEMYLLDRRIDFESGLRRLRLGDRQVEAPTLAFEDRGTRVTLTVFATDDLRITPKYRADGRPVERARIQQVRALLAAVLPNGDTTGPSSAAV